MSNLWTSADAVAATGGRTTCEWVADGLSIDTREINEGDIFVALKDQRDGHDFVQMALSKGAAVALVSRIPDGVSEDAPLLIVDDVLAALENLARFARARTSASVIGVTGSVGKTGTKEMLRTALTGQGRVHAAVRSFNNHWGVPLTLARMPADTDYAIIEIGMNHPNEITPLARLAQLDVAMVTIVAAVHMAAFKDINEIALAKAEIFDGLVADGTAIVNGDLATSPILVAGAKQATEKRVVFGRGEDNDVRLIDAAIDGDMTHVKAVIDGQELSYTIGAPGTHLAMNSLPVLAAIKAVGADVGQAAQNLAAFTAPDGRGARQNIDLMSGGSLELVDESYNANPTSMGASFDVLAASTNGTRRIAIVGDMLELGAKEAAMHADLVELPAIASIDLIHTVGPLMRNLHDALPAGKQGTWAENSTELASKIDTLVGADDIVMVKGSLGTKLAVVVTAIKKLAKG